MIASPGDRRYVHEGWQRRTFAPLWWRTWRYVETEVTTPAEPLVLERFDTAETGYPFTSGIENARLIVQIDRLAAAGHFEWQGNLP